MYLIFGNLKMRIKKNMEIHKGILSKMMHIKLTIKAEYISMHEYVLHILLCKFNIYRENAWWPY